MFKRVLVGIDEGTRGRDAIALARQLASKDAEVTLAHVHSGVTARTNALREEVSYEATLRLLTSVIAESWLEARGRWTSAMTVSAGLRTLAEAVDADLVVVGTTKRSKLVCALQGNPTTETLADLKCVVAVAPEGYAGRVREIRQIGVAYDGSNPSDAALALARRLAEEAGAELSAFDVVPEVDDAFPRTRRFEREVTAIRAAGDRVYPYDDVTGHIVFGDPVEELGGLSTTVDILFAGSRGAGALARLLHPSTTAALTEVVTCPLLVLTKAACERETVVSSRVSEPTASRGEN